MIIILIIKVADALTVALVLAVGWYYEGLWK
jgi:hypothetical protein